MKLSAAQYAKALMELTAEKSGKELSSAVERFVAELAARHELSSWRAIVRAFDNLWRRTYGAANVHLTIAVKTSEKLVDELQKTYPQATVTAAIDPELIGGATIQVDDRLFDGSIKGQLKRMELEMYA